MSDTRINVRTESGPDWLTELLHRHADQLEPSPPPAGRLRDHAERARDRHRRVAVGAVAVAAAVALVVGVGAGGPLLRRAAPPPADTIPTPGPLDGDRAALYPTELPTRAPYGAWSGREPLAPADAPLCLNRYGATGTRAWRFTNMNADTVGYQAVLEFARPGDPRAFEPTATTVMRNCAHPEWGAGADGVTGPGDAGAAIPWGEPGGVGQLFSYATVGRYATVVWLSAPAERKVDASVAEALITATYSRLEEATEQPWSVPDGGLAQGLLRAEDLPADAGEQPVRDASVTPYGFTPWQLCDVDPGPDIVDRQVLFLDAADFEVGGGRLYVTATSAQASALLADLRAGIARCPEAARAPFTVGDRSRVPLKVDADEAAGITYRTDYTQGQRAGESDVFTVALARAGAVVVQVWRRTPTTSRDPGPAELGRLTETALKRARDTLPEATA